MLSKVKIPLHELMDYVLALDESALDADQVEKLIKLSYKRSDGNAKASWGGCATSQKGFMVDVHSTFIESAFHFSLFIHIGLLLRYRSTTTGMFLIFKLTPCVRCFFPENVVQEIETPLFVTNAAYDSGQIKNAVSPGVVDPHGKWHDCKMDIEQYSSDQIEIIQGWSSYAHWMDFLALLHQEGCLSTLAMPTAKLKYKRHGI
ncbi:putative pectinacetylesterase/NOTUM [Helianthus annuus]|nr:putative pectinacetylesterase/NOTUM [Helianthus annuus]